MKKAGLIIFGIIAVAVIILLIAIEVIEFVLGAILLGIAALVLWGLWIYIRKKIRD